MARRIWGVILAATLVAGVFAIVPAQAATEVPATVQIEDPAGDANYLNGQHREAEQGDHVTPADASSVADILKVWFTNDAEKLSLHVQTERPQPSSGAAYIVFLYANADQCLFAEALIAAPSYQGESYSEVEDECSGTDPVAGEIAVEAGPDDSGIITATFPRSAVPSFAAGATITAPRVQMRNATGAPGSSLRFPVIDDTKFGTDYRIQSGGDDVEADKPDVPGKDETPGKRKGCTKKAKGKGCKKGKTDPKPKADSCAAYHPGELGAEAETVVVTDEHTAEAPLEVTIEQAAGLANDLGLGQYDGTSRTVRNIQVDSKGSEAGLYVRYEFPVYEDHDEYFYYPSGTEGAHVGGFNPAPPAYDGTGSGGHSEQGAEQLDGLKTLDCQGWTAEFVNYLGEGGEYTVKIWLGEIQNDPAEDKEG